MKADPHALIGDDGGVFPFLGRVDTLHGVGSIQIAIRTLGPPRQPMGNCLVSGIFPRSRSLKLDEASQHLHFWAMV